MKLYGLAETYDLLPAVLAGKGKEKRLFVRRTSSGNEKANFFFLLNPGTGRVALGIGYERDDKNSYFESNFPLSEVPAKLSRKFLRLGCSPLFIERLNAAYLEVLEEVEEVFYLPHEALHTDRGAYDE